MRALLTTALLFALASPVAAQDVTTGLEAHYTLNADGSDETVNARDLAVVRTPAHAAGQVGAAMTRGRYQVAASYLNGDATYTVAYWAKSYGLQYPTVVRIGPNDANCLNLHAATGPPTVNSLTATLSSRVHAARIKPDTNPTLAWHFVALVVSSGSATLYTNASGSLTSTTPAGDWTLPASGCVLTIGQHGAPAAAVDEVRIYSRALAEVDVEALENE